MARSDVLQQALQLYGAVLHQQPAAKELDHLAHRDRLLVHLQNGTRLGPLQDLLKRAHQVHYIGRQLRLGAFRVFKFLERRIAHHRIFNLLFLHQHLRGVLEFFMLQQALY